LLAKWFKVITAVELCLVEKFYRLVFKISKHFLKKEKGIYCFCSEYQSCPKNQIERFCGMHGMVFIGAGSVVVSKPNLAANKQSVVDSVALLNKMNYFSSHNMASCSKHCFQTLPEILSAFNCILCNSVDFHSFIQ